MAIFPAGWVTYLTIQGKTVIVCVLGEVLSSTYLGREEVNMLLLFQSGIRESK